MSAPWPGPALAAEVALDVMGDLASWWLGVRELGVGVDSFVGGGVHVHHGAATIQHSANRGGDPVPVQPVEGLRERHHPNRWEVCGQ